MSKRILIADDDDDALSGLANLLTGMGHEVALATNDASISPFSFVFGG